MKDILLQANIKLRMSKITSYPLNKENPFEEQFALNMGNSLIKQTKSKSGDDEIVMLSDIDTHNNLIGNPLYVKVKRVNKIEFERLVLSGLKDFFKLKPATIKILSYILKELHPDSNGFNLKIAECILETGCSQATVFRALGELCSSEIIARGKSDSHYYINPMCLIYGDRVSFSVSFVNEEHTNVKTTSKRLQGAKKIRINKKSLKGMNLD